MGQKKNFHKGLGCGSSKGKRDLEFQIGYECDQGIEDHYDEEWEEYEELLDKERENQKLTKEETEKLNYFRQMIEEAEASANPQ